MPQPSILIVSATQQEIAPTVAELHLLAQGERTSRYRFGPWMVDVLTTGVGMVATAGWTSRALAATRYEAALNLGLCGSFDPSLAPGAVVHVISDRMSELGAEDGDRFLTLAELDLPGDDVVRNARPIQNRVLASLPAVSGITVNTVHGHERSIADVAARFAPQVESMEGAAFMYACAIHGVAHAQIRAVSNYVERRNRAAWKVLEAVAGLNLRALEILASL